MKKIIYFLVLMLLFPIITNAAACSEKEQTKMAALVTNIKAGYLVVDVPPVYEKSEDGGGDIIIDGDYSYFRLYINNLGEHFFAKISGKGIGKTITITKDDLNEDGSYTLDIDRNKKFKNYSYVIKIYGNDICYNKLFRSFTITTPKYNQYYNNFLCEGIEDYALCQQFYDYDVKYDDFVDRVTSYKANLKKDNNKDKNEDDPTFMDGIVDFLDNNKYYIIGVVAGIGVTILVVRIIIKKRRIL